MIRLIPKLIALSACQPALLYLQWKKHPMFPDALLDVRANYPEWNEWLCDVLALRLDAPALEVEKKLKKTAPVGISTDTWFYVGFNIEQLICDPREFLRVDVQADRWDLLLKKLSPLIGPAKKGYAYKNLEATPLTVRKLYAFLEKTDPTLAQEMQDLVLALHAQFNSVYYYYPYEDLECTPDCFDAVLHYCVHMDAVFEYEDRCYFADEMEHIVSRMCEDLRSKPL